MQPTRLGSHEESRNRSHSRSMAISIGHATSKGSRLENQDAASFGTLENGLRYAIVADGVAGSGNGKLAAHTAVEAAKSHLQKAAASESLPDDDTLEALATSAFAAAEQAVLALQSPAASAQTTLLLALARPDGLVQLAFAGDTRAFLVRAGRLRAATPNGRRIAPPACLAGSPHDPAAPALEPTPTAPAPAAVLGTPCEPATCSWRTQHADVLLLLTDGAWDASPTYLEDALNRIAPQPAAPAQPAAPQPAARPIAQSIVDGALAAAFASGHADNATAVVVSFD